MAEYNTKVEFLKILSSLEQQQRLVQIGKNGYYKISIQVRNLAINDFELTGLEDKGKGAMN